MGLCFSKDSRERDNSYATPEMVSPQYYYSGIIRLSSFRSGPGTPPGVARLLESPRMSSIALDSPRRSVSVSSRDFILSPRMSADVGDTGTLNALLNRSRMVNRPGTLSKYHYRHGGGPRGGGSPGRERNGGKESQEDRTVYSAELSSSQRLATQKILQCVDKESKKHCICCTDCGSKKIAKCRDCGSEKLAICPMCDNRIPRCGECRFGKPLSCGACHSTRLASSLQIEAGKINCGCCGAIMLASCDRCSTRFKRPTCGQCGRPSTDGESRDELEEFSEFGLDQSAEADSSVEFLELRAGVVELRRKPPPRRLPQQRQSASSSSAAGPPDVLHEQQEQEQLEELQEAREAMIHGEANRPVRIFTEEDHETTSIVDEDVSSDCDSTGEGGEETVVEDGDWQQEELAGVEPSDSETPELVGKKSSDSRAAAHTRSISFGKYVPDVAHAAAEAGTSNARHPPHATQAVHGDASFSSFLAESALEALTIEGDGVEGLSLDETSRPLFESVAKSYAEAAALAAAKDAFVFIEENDASLTFPKLFESAPIASTEDAEQWSVPFLSLETDATTGLANVTEKAGSASMQADQVPEFRLADSAEQSLEEVTGTARVTRTGSTIRDHDSKHERKEKGKAKEFEEPFMPTRLLQDEAESSSRDFGPAGSAEDADPGSKIMDHTEERVIRAQLHTHGFLLDSLSKEEFTDQLKLRHAALRQKAAESGAASGAMAGVGENIARNLQRKSAEFMRTTVGKEQEITEVEEEVAAAEADRSQDFRKKKSKEKGGFLSSVSGGTALFPNKHGSRSKLAVPEQIHEGLEDRPLFTEGAFTKRNKENQHAKVRADNHINMSEFIEALKASSKLPADRQEVYPLTRVLEPVEPSPVRDGAKKGKAVSWGYVVREPRSKSFEENRARYPIFEDDGVRRRRHSLESDKSATVRDSDLKSCLKMKSSVPPAPSSLTIGPGIKRYPPSSRPGKVPLTFNSDPFMPQAEVLKAAPDKKGKSKSSESFKYESLAAFSMIQAYDSDISANGMSYSPREFKQSVSSRSRGPFVTLDSNNQVNRPLSRGTNSVVSANQGFGGSSGETHLPWKPDSDHAVESDDSHVSVQDLCDVLTLSSTEGSSPTHRSSRIHGSESRKAGSLRRSSSGGKMAAMGMESSSSSYMSLRNYGAMEEDIENFLGASPSHNKSVRKAEVQRKVSQIAGVAHLQKQPRSEEAKPSDWISTADLLEDVPLETIDMREDRAMAYIVQSRKAALDGATTYTDVGSPASSMDEEVEKFVVGGPTGRLDDAGTSPRRNRSGKTRMKGERVNGKEDSNLHARKSETSELPPRQQGDSDLGSAFGSPLDAVAPQRSEYAQAYKTARGVSGGEHSRRSSSGDGPVPDPRRGHHGTVAHGLPAFLAPDFEPMGVSNSYGGVRSSSFSGRRNVPTINGASILEVEVDISRDRMTRAWDSEGDSDSSSDLFEIETDSSLSSRRKARPATTHNNNMNKKPSRQSCEVIDLALFEEFAESLAASPISVTLSVSSLDACRGSDINVSVNFSEDDGMEDLLVYPRVSAAGLFTPIFSEEETTELDSDYNSRWSSSIKSSSVSGSAEMRGLGPAGRFGPYPMGSMPLPVPLPPRVHGGVLGSVPAKQETDAAPTTASAKLDQEEDTEQYKKSAEGQRLHDYASERLGIRRSRSRYDMDAETTMVSSSDVDLRHLSSTGLLTSLSVGDGAGAKNSDADMSSIEISPAMLTQPGSVFEAFGQMYLLRPRRHVTYGRLPSRPRRYPTGGRV